MSQLNITNIPSARVPVIDQRSGLISREWYLFFFNLFNITGSGSSDISIDDLQIAPNKKDYSSIANISISQNNINPISRSHDTIIEKSNRVIQWLSM